MNNNTSTTEHLQKRLNEVNKEIDQIAKENMTKNVELYLRLTEDLTHEKAILELTISERAKHAVDPEDEPPAELPNTRHVHIMTPEEAIDEARREVQRLEKALDDFNNKPELWDIENGRRVGSQTIRDALQEARSYLIRLEQTN
jgi:hypothetical protein